MRSIGDVAFIIHTAGTIRRHKIRSIAFAILGRGAAGKSSGGPISEISTVSDAGRRSEGSILAPDQYPAPARLSSV